MEGSTLNVESCSSSKCKIRINFGWGDRLGLLFLNQPTLKYKIYVTNKNQGLLKTFSIISRFDSSKVLIIPLEGIEGDLEDFFDIQVSVYKLKPDGNSEPIHCTKVQLLHYERIVQNRITTKDEPSVKTKGSNPTNEPRTSVLTLTQRDANYAQINLQLDPDTNRDMLIKGMKVYYEILMKNITRGKSVLFSSDTEQSNNVQLHLPLDGVPGSSTDKFDIVVKVYNTKNKLIPITSASLEVHRKLLLFRITDEEKARRKEEEKRRVRQRERYETLRRLEEEEEKLRKQREDEEQLRKQREEKLKKQREEEERIKREEEAERQRVKNEKKAREERYRRLIEQYELSRRQQEAAKVRRQRQLTEVLRKQGEKDKYDKISYLADVSVEITNPRKVSIRVQFSEDTHQKLVFETNQLLQNRNLLEFKLTATNQNATTSQVYQGNVALTQHLPFELSLKLGNKYKFLVDVKKFSPDHGFFVTFLSKTVEHKEVLLKSELRTLMQMGKQFQQTGYNGQRLPVKFAYRNKPPPYFANIKQNRSNIMEVYIKDNNGDPGCPINGQINGLFFAVRLEPNTMQIPRDSLFGTVRIILPIEKLLQTCPNFYFADFYCHKKIHYLTLVATKPNSQADKFCRAHTLEISLEDNPFFYREQPWSFLGNSEYEYYCCREPRVEILFTENVDLNSHYIEWDTATPIGRGCSTPGGLPKRRNCGTCNLLQPFQTLLGNLNSF